MRQIDLYIDPGINSCGLAAFEGQNYLVGDTITANPKEGPLTYIPMVKELVFRWYMYLAPPDAHKLALITYEEPNLSGRFLSKSQRTMDRFLGALCWELSRGLLEPPTFAAIHPMTLKAGFGAAKGDKLDMALEAGQYLCPKGQDAMSQAIEEEKFDLTDALCLAALRFKNEAQHSD